MKKGSIRTSVICLIILLSAASAVLTGCSGDTFQKYKLERLPEVSTPTPDTTAPDISSISASAKDTILVTFSETVEISTAGNAANYHIQGNNRVTVTSAAVLNTGGSIVTDSQDATCRTVSLTVSTGTYGMQQGKDYTLLVQRVKDITGNAILTAFSTFLGRGPVAAVVSYDGAALPVESPFPYYNVKNLELSVGGTDVGSYMYSLDGSAWSSEITMSDKISLTNLSDGYHTLAVVGKNSSTGEWQDGTQATETAWTIDTIAPAAVLTGVPSNITDVSKISVTVGGEGVAYYKYRLNTGSWSSYISASIPITASDLVEGSYTLYVRGRDNAGNEQSSDTACSWTITSTGSVAVLSNLPTRYTRMTSIDVAVTGTNVYFYRYAINGTWSDFQSAGTDIIVENLAEGDYTIQVRGSKTASADTEGSSVEYVWTVDRTAPMCTISNLPSTTTNSQKTHILVSSDSGDVVAYKYRVISGGSSGTLSGQCSIDTPIELSALGENSYTIRVMGIDAAGNIQSESDATAYSWNVDITAPAAVLSGLPSTITNDGTLTVTVGGTGVVAYKYLIDTGSWSSEYVIKDSAGASYSLPIEKVFASGEDGTHTLCVIGRDEAGNWQSIQSSTSFVWQLDRSAPTAELSNLPALITSQTVAGIYVGGSGVTSYRWQLDGGTLSQPVLRLSNGSISLSGLDSGSHTIKVYAIDLAGNVQADATTYSWTIDTAIPTAVLDNKPPSLTTLSSINVSVESSVASYKYKLDSDLTWSAPCIPGTDTIAKTGLSDGLHTLYVIGISSSGLTQSTPTTITWTVDTAAPQAALSGEPSGSTNLQTAAVTVSGNGVYGFRYRYYLSGDTAPSYGAEVDIGQAVNDNVITLSNLGGGSYVLDVLARDEAGNWQSSPTSTQWTVDTSVPSATLVGTPESLTSDQTLSAAVGGTNVIYYKYSFDGGSWSDAASTSVLISRVGLSEGSHSLSVIGENTAGTWQSAGSATTYSWTIDSTAPASSNIVLSNCPGNPTSDIYANFNVSGSGAELSYIRYRLDTGSGTVSTGTWSGLIAVDAATGTSIVSLTGLVSNTYTINIIACDAAGNWTDASAPLTYTWKIDTISPVAAITQYPSNPSNSAAADIVIAGTGILQYKYSVDGGSWSSSWIDISTHLTLNFLSDGTHTLKVIGSKGSGFDQTTANATTYTWNVDTAAPAAVLSSLPASGTTNLYADITAAGDGVVGYRYRLDSGNWIPTSSYRNIEFPISLRNLSYGSHTVDVIGVDAAGNFQSASSATTYTWTIAYPALAAPSVSDGGETTTSDICFAWLLPAGTGNVKIQIASDAAFSNIVYGGSAGIALSSVSFYDFVPTDPDIQTYYARVALNSSSSAAVGDSTWTSWGTSSDGITVTGGVSGYVYDPVGKTYISGSSVILETSTGAYAIGGDQAKSTALTDADGAFVFSNVPIASSSTNQYKVIVSKTGYSSSAKNNIVVAKGQTISAGRINLTPSGLSSGKINGTTIDANDGSAVTSAAITVFDWEGNTVYTGASSSSDGSFTTSSIAGGVYTVVFSKSNYYTLSVDNQVVNGALAMDRQALCHVLYEPQVRVVVLWGSSPQDLDLHLVGPTSKTLSETPSNRFHIGYVPGRVKMSYYESTGDYSGTADPSGTTSTASWVLDDVDGYGPEAINIFRCGGVQYSKGIYSYTVRNYSTSDWYAVSTTATARVYDATGMVREISLPLGASTPAGTTRDWKLLKINVQGNSNAKRTIYVETQSPFGNCGSDSSKTGFDW